jgi:histidinol phosphatase-like enzyme (inositol monophosphatase family)
MCFSVELAGELCSAWLTDLEGCAMTDAPRRTGRERIALAERLADHARPIALAHWRHRMEVESKSDATPVTAADRAIEAELRALLAEVEPGAAIFGEEYGASGATAGPGDVWVLDPIDGTGAFVTGSPLFGTLIGLLSDGAPFLGVIEVPALGERWTGMRGEGAFLNGARCATSGARALSDAALGATSPLVFGEADRARFLDLSRRAALTRFGGDCYAYALLASGHLDLVVEAGLKPYDYLPVVPVVEEAGGVMTDWAGEPLGLGSDGRVIAASSHALHAEALEMLHG